MFCSKCGADMANGAKFCSKCGTAVNSAYICPNCGKEVSLDDIFCPSCGIKVIKTEEELSLEKSVLRNDKLNYIYTNCEVIESFNQGKTILFKYKNESTHGKYALVLIDDIDRICISDASDYFKWDDFCNENFVKNKNIMILQQEADMVGMISEKNALICYVGSKAFCYRFSLGENNEINEKCDSKLMQIYELSKQMKIYELNEGRRYILDGTAVLDEHGNELWKDDNTAAKSNDSDIFDESENFPAPFWFHCGELINLLTGKCVLRDVKTSAYLIKTFKDKYTSKKIMEISSGELFGDVTYEHYEIKFDSIEKIYYLDDAESLSAQADRYEEYQDGLSKYRK
jgi:DNA-directed RNA polymerase subunit RPC12/RpoP